MRKGCNIRSRDGLKEALGPDIVETEVRQLRPEINPNEERCVG